jgi:hypothetical protein
MAILYPQATLSPTKVELLTTWLPTREWYRGPAEPVLTRVGGYRFDDPDGEVGIETLLVQAGDGPLYQVPLTYRGNPLHGRDEWLVGTSQHSVLGRRWIYDGCGDPLYARTLATAIITGASGAEEVASIDGRRERRTSTMTVRGGGTPDAAAPSVSTIISVHDGNPAVIVTDSVHLAVHRLLSLGAGAGHNERAVLTGTWSLQPAPVLLAQVHATG